MDETNYITTEAPSLIGVGAQSIVDQAKQLGLTWNFQPGSVVEAGNSTCTVEFDGDTSAIICANLTDTRLLPGTRVMGILTPTGNYIIATTTRYVSPWAPMILENGWTNPTPPSVAGSYRRIAPNSVQLVGELFPGTTADGTTITTLPTGFWPISDTAFPIARNPHPTTGVLGPLLQLRPGGVLRIFGAAGATTIWFSAIVPLDAPS